MMNKKSGFTLMEIIIVIAILAILAMMLFANLLNQVAKGRDSRRKEELASLQRILEDYFNDKGQYPHSMINTLDGLGCATNPSGLKPYIAKIPCDPQFPSRIYFYVNDSNTYLNYRIYALLENNKDPDVLKNPCAGGCKWGSHLFNYVVTNYNTNILSQPLPPPGYIGPP